TARSGGGSRRPLAARGPAPPRDRAAYGRRPRGRRPPPCRAAWYGVSVWSWISSPESRSMPAGVRLARTFSRRPSLACPERKRPPGRGAAFPGPTLKRPSEHWVPGGRDHAIAGAGLLDVAGGRERIVE